MRWKRGKLGSNISLLILPHNGDEQCLHNVILGYNNPERWEEVQNYLLKLHLTNEVYGKLISSKDAQMVDTRLLHVCGGENKIKLSVLTSINLPLK